MAEYIGSRISLISKRDIRYVGTLHEISSENSTVALENVVSFGTEGRRSDGEVPASDNVYDYIVFRGSDVKDLRIEEPKENVAPKPPQIPDDPAILGSARRPNSTQAPTPQQQRGPLQTPPSNQPPQVQGPQGVPNQPIQLPQGQQDSQRQGPPQLPHQPYHQYYPPPNQQYGMPGSGFPPGSGFRGMPYGPPPGWYPPPGQGFPPHMQGGNFYPPQMPIGPPSQMNRQMGPPPPQQQQKQSPVAPPAAEENKPQQTQQPVSKPQSPKPTATVKLPSATVTPNPPVAAEPPPPPTESKPDVAAALAPPAPSVIQTTAPNNKSVPTAPKSGRIVPAVPLASPGPKPSAMTNGVLKEHSFATSQPPTSQAATAPLTVTAPAPATKTIEEASRDARAAVRAAMAKLPSAPSTRKAGESQQSAVDNLTAKVNEMKATENNRHSRQTGFATNHRGPRGGFRGTRGHSDFQNRKIEVPKADYDFESANAKFNKQDLVKEAIASGSPVASTPADTPANGTSDAPLANGGRRESAVDTGTPSYNKNSSFFDDISSEAKERAEASGGKLGGREFRNEERQKNMETFGQGSVDGNFRGGFRGRGRGRGYGRGMRGGYAPRGGLRGGQRGARGGAVAAET